MTFLILCRKIPGNKKIYNQTFIKNHNRKLLFAKQTGAIFNIHHFKVQSDTL